MVIKMPVCEYGNLECTNIAKIRLLINNEKYNICESHASCLQAPVQRVLRDFTTEQVGMKMFNKSLKPVKG